MKDSNQENRLFGPRMHEDPFPVYRHLRESSPIFWDDTIKAWVVTDFANVSAIMKDRALSSDRVSLARHRYAERYQPVFDLMASIMVQTDEPRHGRLRKLVNSAFARTRVEAYEQRIRLLCRELLSSGMQRGRMEFVSEFAVPLPVLVISEVVGIPAEERKQIKLWCDAFSTFALNFYVHLTDQQLDECSEKIEDFRSYILAKIDNVRKTPDDDLLSSLLLAADQDHALDIDELIANCIFLLAAGNETTTCLLANGLGLLLNHPEQMRKLRDDPSLIPNAIEEMLRLEGPIQFLGRVATEDFEIDGNTIKAGEMLVPVLASANRDPKMFEDPDRFDVTRQHIHQLGFGTGPHQCAGIHLARFEAKIAFEEILNNLDEIEPEISNFSHRVNFNMRCLEQLPIIIHGKTS